MNKQSDKRFYIDHEPKSDPEYLISDREKDNDMGICGCATKIDAEFVLERLNAPTARGEASELAELIDELNGYATHMMNTENHQVEDLITKTILFLSALPSNEGVIVPCPCPECGKPYEGISDCGGFINDKACLFDWKAALASSNESVSISRECAEQLFKAIDPNTVLFWDNNKRNALLKELKTALERS